MNIVQRQSFFSPRHVIRLRPSLRLAICAAFLLSIVVFLSSSTVKVRSSNVPFVRILAHITDKSTLQQSRFFFAGRSSHESIDHNVTNQRLHVLIPATHPNINLCKTILSASLLGYPAPILINWNQELHPNQANGGTHLAKIAATLPYLQGLDPSHDDDLVLLVDAYDLWFLLPESVLIERYFNINHHANKRLATRLGRKAVAEESISQTVVFGAGKRCAPNQIHTIACYPIPDSPLPDDLYYENTDTDLGPNEHFFHKHRWLNSGSIMGPVRDLRNIFARAEEILQSQPKIDPEDNGSHSSDGVYYGSDQSIFAKIWGQQEFQREVIRRRYGGDPNAEQNPGTRRKDSFRGKQRGGFWTRVRRFPSSKGHEAQDEAQDGMLLRKRSSGNIDALRPFDILSPPFMHEKMEPLDGHPLEFGIGVDYFADLAHQTINSEADVRWLLHNQSLSDQITDRTRWDCKWRLPENGLPKDILSDESMRILQDVMNGGEEVEGDGVRWEDQLLYTHLCLGTIPAMIHHNGDKGARERDWSKPWWQIHSRSVLDRKNREVESGATMSWQEYIEQPRIGTGREWGGAWTNTADHEYLRFEQLCPNDWHDELFG